MGETFPALMSIFGTAYSATASVRAGNAENDLAVSNAGVALENAKVQDFNAADAVARGSIDETTHRQQVKQLIGKQRVSLAAQGQDLSSGSALDVQTDTARQGEVDALTIRSNAAREAWGYKVAGYNDRVQAANDVAQGKIAKQKGRSAAIQTILTDGSRLLYTKYGSNTSSKAKGGGGGGTTAVAPGDGF